MIKIINELLERVRSIRASERRIWFKITDIFREEIKMTMIKTVRLIEILVLPFKINFIMQSLAKSVLGNH